MFLTVKLPQRRRKPLKSFLRVRRRRHREHITRRTHLHLQMIALPQHVIKGISIGGQDHELTGIHLCPRREGRKLVIASKDRIFPACQCKVLKSGKFSSNLAKPVCVD